MQDQGPWVSLEAPKSKDLYFDLLHSFYIGILFELRIEVDMAASSVLSYPIASLVGIYGLYLFGLVIYRLYFHPLAKFPGPKYAAISRWHEFYYEVVKQGQFTFKVQELHKKYGSLRSSISGPQIVTGSTYSSRPYRSDRSRRNTYSRFAILRDSLHQSRTS